MTEGIFEHELAALTRQLSDLEQSARKDHDALRAKLPDVLFRMRGSLSEFQASQVDATSEANRGSPREGSSAKTDGRVSSSAGIVAPSADVGTHQLRMRSLMADLLVAEERERRRLADDLHDGLSQTLALANIKLAVLRRAVPETLAQSVKEVEELIEQADRAARSISFELSPPVLHDLGLEPAVQWLVENIHARYGIEIVLEDDGEPKPTDEKTRVIVFRSIRELLINAAKHAGAQRVRVSLRRDASHLSASVADDGVGMNPKEAEIKGSGLFSIHERLNHVGGSMRIDSTPGGGTHIHVFAPLANENRASVKS